MSNNITILGVTPSEFAEKYGSVEFDFDDLMTKFADFCKDFKDNLEMGKASKALEFSAKILFECGPYIRNEKKSKGDTAIRFKFPYVKDRVNLSIKTVIVSTFKETFYKNVVEDSKMILTFKQAAMLAMVTFSKAIGLIYSNQQIILMTPLCGAIYSRESIPMMSKDLGLEEIEVIRTINDSTASGGHNLPHSDTACAIAAMISATKKVCAKNVREAMIAKTVKQYSAKGKPYLPKQFEIYAKYALGGVPPGMDSETLIQNFTNIQTQEVNARMAAKASLQTAYKAKGSSLTTKPAQTNITAPQTTYDSNVKK